MIDELVREDARRMLAEALQAEIDNYIARFGAELNLFDVNINGVYRVFGSSTGLPCLWLSVWLVSLYIRCTIGPHGRGAR